MEEWEVAAAYDARAEEYADLLGSVDQMAPEDRAAITGWASSRDGRLLDAGCGPAHWTDLLGRQRRGGVIGVDASPGFLTGARRRFPQVPLLRADLRALPFADASYDGVLAWFSLIHVRPDEISDHLAELARVIVPGGSLLLGFFDGEPGRPFDHAVTTAFTWSSPALADLLRPHDLEVVRSTGRHDPGRRPQGRSRHWSGADTGAWSRQARPTDQTSRLGRQTSRLRG